MSDSLDEIIIREFTPEDSLEELTELLHLAYKQLADMDLRYLATHQDAATTARRIENGICLVVEYQNIIIGTITYYAPDKTKSTELLNIKGSAWLGQMGVHPDWQRKGVGLKLINHAEHLAKISRVPKIGLDTSEKATHLIKWYNKLGYKFVRYVNWDITNYRSVVLIKEL